MTKIEKEKVREGKRKRRKILFFLRWLRKTRKKFQEAKGWYDDWSELVGELQSWLKENNDFPESQGLKKAMEIANAGLEGLDATAQALDLLEPLMVKAIDALPAGGVSLGTVVVGLVLVAAVAIGVIVMRIKTTAVQINISNDGCAPISVSKGVVPALDDFLGLAGIEFPSGSIPSGGSGEMKLPAVKLVVDATNTDDIKLTVAGIKTSVSWPRRVTQIVLDGEPLLGNRVTVDLGQSKRHSVVVQCR